MYMYSRNKMLDFTYTVDIERKPSVIPSYMYMYKGITPETSALESLYIMYGV